MRFAFPLFGLACILGAGWVRVGNPGLQTAWFDAAKLSEPFHVFAHAVLYGTCAALVLRRFGPAWAVPATLSVGLFQELAQVVGRRPFGEPELFDLGVDGLAAALVVLGAVAHASGRREAAPGGRAGPPGEVVPSGERS